MDNLLIPAISVEQRKEALKQKLIAQFGKDRVHSKVLRAIGLLSAGSPPKLQLCENQKNTNTSGTRWPGQVLLENVNAYAFGAARFGVLKAANLAAIPGARKFTYADVFTFPLAGSENVSIQSIFNCAQVSLFVNTSEPVMQPLAMSYFETEANPQAAAGTVAVNPPYSERYRVLDKDYGITGGNQNFFSFDFTDVITTGISPAADNYIFVETDGFVILDANGAAMDMAKQAKVCY